MGISIGIAQAGAEANRGIEHHHKGDFLEMNAVLGGRWMEMTMRSDWVEVELGLACLRAKKIKRKEMPLSDSFMYLDIGGLDNKSNRITEHKMYTWKDAPSRAQQLVKFSDVLFSTVRTYLKNIALITDKKYEGQICSSGFTVIRSKEELLNSKYAFYLTLHEAFLQPLNELQTGTSYPAVRDSDVFAQMIPLAPLPEQRAIVAKIEQLFSELDNGVANLKTARDKLVLYRQAVLKKAFEGELTREWRESQTDLPSAEELLEQIKAERQRHYQQQLDDWQNSVRAWEAGGKVGKKPGRPKEVKEIESLTSQEKESLFKLDECFLWLKIGNLTLQTEYGSSAKSLENGEVPVLRMGNIQNGIFDWSDLVYSSDPQEIKQYTLRYNDVLFNRTNSPELVGKTAIYKEEKPAIFAGYLIRINQIPAICNADYLNYYLNSHTAKTHGNFVKTDGVNQSNINAEKLKNYPFPYCSPQEQTQIVKEIETRLSAADRLREEIDKALKKAEALRQSILKKAFQGRLLTEAELADCRAEPDWEPADRLLEKIQAEKKPRG
uniref:Type I restriction enzyme, S subunit n=1 Tax=Candidatus Kentrum sp. DK TaxID=2126562 RepID=A0A450T0U3_9GAMM|nr:MAG: type I restriction enzyme, S subunit [Candidatus Kentron sp. DK]VFJ60111.1 MAG: type I restriction enzyme, S subunit [Candidatus Kentron sp. DK]